MPKLIRASVILVLMAFMVSVGIAQGATFTFDTLDKMQEFTGNINDAVADEILVFMENLEVGDTLYVMAIGSGDVDPYLIVTDTSRTSSLAQDNNSGGGVNAALTFDVEAEGSYVLAMFSINGTGEYRLVVGINDPSIVDVPLEETSETELENDIRGTDTFIGLRDEMQRFSGAFQSEDDEVLVVFADLEIGDIIYIYAAGLGFVDTYLEVMNPELNEIFAEDDDGGGGYNSVLSYEVEEAGTYTVRLTTIDQIGNYEITAGVNTPQVLDLINAPPVLTVQEGGFDCESVDRLGSRPNLSGFDLTREGEAYIVHYTLEGEDATTEEYIDAMVDAIERSLDIQFNDLGWLPPPADCGEGGDSRLDIYVLDLINSPGIGVAVPEGVVGDNPLTERVESFATYSYLLVDNDMDFLAGGIALDLMTSTVAHEIHHNIQFGYDFNDSFHGFYEAGATWIETLVYPTSNTVYEYVEDVFERPDVCIGRLRGVGLREYGEWLMIDSFVRDLGIESYQFIWEFLGTRQGLPGFYDALRALDSSPQEVMEHMAIRNLILDYALAKRFASTVFIEGNVTGTGFVSPIRNGVQELGVDYVAITTLERYTFELPANEALTMFVVGINTETENATVYDIGQRGTVDTAIYDYAYIIVLNTIEHSDFDNCNYTDWTITIQDGRDEPLAIADPDIWNASQFVPVR